MPLQVIFQTLSYIHSLWHNPHTIGKVFYNAVHQQWIMCTSQDNRIYVSIFTHQLVNALLDEIISTRTISLIGFYDSRPKRTSNTANLDFRPEFGNLQVIALTFDSTFRSQQTDMVTLGDIAYNLSSRTDNTQHTAAWIQLRDISLLDRTKRLG